MPRIPHLTLLKAYKKSKLLPLVVRGSRTLPSAINELRWLKEHVEDTSHRKELCRQRKKLLLLCKRRSRGEPLQYIIGSQPFGELDIKCRPGVLIPRTETETYTTYLADLITSHRLDHVLRRNFAPGDEVFAVGKKTKTPALKILDLCTGSGCISLLLGSLISKTRIRAEIYGCDISKTAITSARDNQKHNSQLGHVKKSSIYFGLANIFGSNSKLRDIIRKHSNRPKEDPEVDIIVSNPPYISLEAFKRETTRSVRNWEPKLALIPWKKEVPKDVDPADIFYDRLFKIHLYIFRSSVLLMEVGDEAQALRVAKMAIKQCKASNRIEIWKDNPHINILEDVNIGDQKIAVRGIGQFRVVALFRYNRLTEDTLLPQDSEKPLLQHAHSNTIPASNHISRNRGSPQYMYVKT